MLSKGLVDDIFAHALKKQTGVALKYMLDFGANPIDRQLLLSAQFLHKELPVRLAHRVAELENLPYGLSAKSNILAVSKPWLWLLGIVVLWERSLWFSSEAGVYTHSARRLSLIIFLQPHPVLLLFS
jgi:hypothetical protein